MSDERREMSRGELIEMYEEALRGGGLSDDQRVKYGSELAKLRGYYGEDVGELVVEVRMAGGEYVDVERWRRRGRA